ncbi:hypothetical protein TraAM80_04873 [Trypanosoma rangeli]|uniref:Uncharacterized protein n=1 Tax=Trypanosoma rangeli TaxID=5698 RepID=A0A422NGV4_TRYRA|nr:uncharacterized protein TraAM80_04873 [Trypanosoma rangeli]RNF04677.1 hypothetical protein TraAM80_04873 [Trypanosoma rangeli]|eukprot:RNF04677.1 hypothetical protein TraAM80_04873 [Trypanosoma rangeli]
MFAVDLLDALAEAAVILLFDWTPTSACGDEDNDGEIGSERFTGLNSWSSLDSCFPRSQMNTTLSANNASLTASRTLSLDCSSFLQVAAEEIQTTPSEQLVGSQDHYCWTNEYEYFNSSSSTPSSWAVPVRSLEQK